MNVCGWPISFVASGVILMRAFTQRLTAGPELPAVPFVVRLSVTPLTETVVLAETVVTPVVSEVRSIVHDPVAPTVVHGFVVVKRARAGVDREADRRPGRRVHEAGAVVHVHVRREGVRLPDAVRRRRRRDLDVRVDDRSGSHGPSDGA